MKNIMIIVLALSLGACAVGNNPIYTLKSETGDFVTQVPGWFMQDYSSMEVCSTDKTHELRRQR